MCSSYVVCVLLRAVFIRGWLISVNARFLTDRFALSGSIVRVIVVDERLQRLRLPVSTDFLINQEAVEDSGG